jgi:hypothetical protein
MRRFTLIQDIATDVDDHWRLFLDEERQRKQYVEEFRFPHYEVLNRQETEAEITRKIRVVPKLEVPAAVAKLLGRSFGYTEDQTFDKRNHIYRARTTPSILGDRMSSETTVKVEPAGHGRCRRICEITVDARIFGIGGLVESAFEKNLRAGWEQSAAYMNAELRARGS